MMDVLLSVIVPVYNAEMYLHQCVDSLIGASDSSVEIILVDDGSTDKSGEICDGYAAMHANISVVHQKNGGVISARKAGVSISCGRYVTFVDSDDWVETSMYKEMLSKACENDADVVICEILRETEKQTIYLKNYIEGGFYDKQRLKKEFYPRMLFDFDVCAPALSPSLCNKLIKRDILKQVIFDVDDTIVFGEDALCSYPSLLKADSVYLIKKGLYHYRQNMYSVTNVYDSKLFCKFLLLHDELKRQFGEIGFDDKLQLKGYVARFSLVCIRKELLFNKASLKRRMDTVSGYVSDIRISDAFAVTYELMCDRKVKTKIKLSKNKRFFVLYILFLFKEMILRLKGRKYEN